MDNLLHITPAQSRMIWDCLGCASPDDIAAEELAGFEHPAISLAPLEVWTGLHGKIDNNTTLVSLSHAERQAILMVLDVHIQDDDDLEFSGATWADLEAVKALMV